MSRNGFDLDDFLTAGHILSKRQIESMAAHLRTATGRNAREELHNRLDTGTFDQRLSVVEDFFKWSLYSANRGGTATLSLERLLAERARLEQVFRSLRIGARPSQRIQPLEPHEIDAIRRAIGPQPTQGDT